MEWWPYPPSGSQQPPAAAETGYRERADGGQRRSHHFCELQLLKHFTFTFSHLADAFVQSDVQGREQSS